MVNKDKWAVKVSLKEKKNTDSVHVFSSSPLQPTENGNIYVSFVILLLETTLCLCIMTKQEVNPVITSLTPLH